MTLGATAFLGSATDRLLPMAVPFRFFGAATVFHIAAWVVLLIGAEQAAEFRGGAGPVLAALHLLTLGVFLMTAMGASLQLLPVATLQGFGAPRAIGAIWWLLTLGTLCLTFGMYDYNHHAMALGGGAVAISIVVYLWLLAGNLHRGRAMAAVVAHGWLAGAALVVLLVMALALIVNQEHDLLADSQRTAVSHMLLATYGFMGLLALGFSYILVPMFALAPMPPLRWAMASLILVSFGLILAVFGVWFGRDLLAAIGGVIGLGGVAIHLTLMSHSLRQRMRKRLGPAFLLIRLSWSLLPLSVLIGIAWAIGILPDWGPGLFAMVLLAWLLGFLLAILQRIVPFLASMHAAVAIKRRPPTVKALTAELPLAIHFYCHCAALLLFVAGVTWPLPLLVKLGALSGVVGGLGFFWFFASALLKYQRAVNNASA